MILCYEKNKGKSSFGNSHVDAPVLEEANSIIEQFKASYKTEKHNLEDEQENKLQKKINQSKIDVL